MRLMNPFRWAILSLALALVAPDTCPATTITGHLNYGGQPLNGYVSIGLVYPGTNGTALDLPGNPGPIPVYNGNFPVMTVDGNDTLQPRGTFYQVTYYDAYQAPLARMNYLITGASFDLGTAIPTPITLSNINLLDLTGLRNISAQTLTLVNGLTLGPVTYSSTGVTGAKQFDDLRFASAYSATSTTCGVMEAIAALPATGGTIFLGAGQCTVTTPITISKPVTLIGLGQGGATGTSTYFSPSVLLNGMPASPLITVTPSPVTSTLAGVTLTNFAIQGNGAVGGASSGDNILINGGTSGGAVNDVHLTGLLLHSAFGSGVTVAESTSNITLDHVVSVHNLGSGLRLTTTTGTQRTIVVTNSVLSSNSGDGVRVGGAGAHTLSISDTALASNLGNGVNVLSGATSAQVSVTTSILDDNSNAGALFADGFNHTITRSQLTGGAHQQFGVNTTQPTIAGSTVELTLTGNSFLPTNLTTDVVQGAAVSNLLIYPQSSAFSSTYGAAGNVHFIAPGSARSCSAGACYKVEADGTITEWGIATQGACGSSHCTTAITFPLAFPAAVDSCSVTPGSITPTGGWNMIASQISSITLTTLNADMDTSQTAIHFTNPVPVDWTCIGH